MVSSVLRWSLARYLSCCCRRSAEASPSSARAAGPALVTAPLACPPDGADLADPDRLHRRGLRCGSPEAACGLRCVLTLQAEHAVPAQEAKQLVAMPCCQACHGAHRGVHCGDPHVHARVGSVRREGLSSGSSAAAVHARAACAGRCLCWPGTTAPCAGQGRRQLVHGRPRHDPACRRHAADHMAGAKSPE